MSELHFPWLVVAVVVPLVGSVAVGRLRDSDLGRNWCLVFCGATFVCALGAWLDFTLLHVVEADERKLLSGLLGADLFVVDQLSAPLLPLTALLYALTTLATVRTKIRRFSFAWTLASEAIALAAFCCKDRWGLVALLVIGVVPPYIELRDRGKPTRVYVVYMVAFVGLLVLGQALVDRQAGQPSLWAVAPLLAAVMLRCGIVPFHGWMTDMFEHASFGTALLRVTPMVGAYAAVRLLLPIAPDSALHVLGGISLVTAVYASGMALVQREARRFFCFLFLSHSALVLVGLGTAVTPPEKRENLAGALTGTADHAGTEPSSVREVSAIGLTGALCVWLSVCLALTGLGLTLRALEARRGRLLMTEFQGLYEHTPNLAMCFALTGLASVGFPGTFGFVGTEILIDGAFESFPYDIGVAVVLAAALNGIAIVQAYFRLFAGTRYASSVSLLIRVRERYAVLALAAMILLGGLNPQQGVASRHAAAEELLRERAALAAGGELRARRSTSQADARRSSAVE
ncbi:MAG TPA: proton-conducting transporter membrane subunit [Pirellulales bacterium]|jgi:NADH-quinone oxidoreductase subunit M|nr:proton-conducting transporter membrane subunit [Pirellulales bacterium]